MRPLIVSLDLECTGTEVERHHVVEIGLVVAQYVPRELHQLRAFDSFVTLGSFSSLVGWTLEELASADPEAMSVHGIPVGNILAAPRADAVDDLASQFLGGFDGAKVALGWNVAGFDLQFVRKFLPKTFDQLSYRTIDLNATLFLISGAFDMSYEKLKRWLKDEAKLAIDAAINVFAVSNRARFQWHSAFYDALAALEVWRILNRAVLPSGELLRRVNKDKNAANNRASFVHAYAEGLKAMVE
jgi:DNA polymerase III epsilon subunit-like protein